MKNTMRSWERGKGKLNQRAVLMTGKGKGHSKGVSMINLSIAGKGGEDKARATKDENTVKRET